MSTPSTWTLLYQEASAWSFQTYEQAKTFLCAMREAGVDETDPDVLYLIREIQSFHRTHFVMLNCGVELFVSPN